MAAITQHPARLPNGRPIFLIFLGDTFLGHVAPVRQRPQPGRMRLPHAIPGRPEVRWRAVDYMGTEPPDHPEVGFDRRDHAIRALVAFVRPELDREDDRRFDTVNAVSENVRHRCPRVVREDIAAAEKDTDPDVIADEIDDGARGIEEDMTGRDLEDPGLGHV